MSTAVPVTSSGADARVVIDSALAALSSVRTAVKTKSSIELIDGAIGELQSVRKDLGGYLGETQIRLVKNALIRADAVIKTLKVFGEGPPIDVSFSKEFAKSTGEVTQAIAETVAVTAKTAANVVGSAVTGIASGLGGAGVVIVLALVLIVVFLPKIRGSLGV